MFNLTAGARPVLDRYLAEVRAALRHCPAVDAADVERDVAEHIELALDGRPTPVDAWELRRVLDELGSPTRWVPLEDLGPFRRALLNLRAGPDDLRLGYIAFGLLAGSLLGTSALAAAIGWDRALPFLAIGALAGFVFARAALAITPEVGPAERWLLYPPVLAVVVPATAVAILWPVAFAALVGDVLRNGSDPSTRDWARRLPNGRIEAIWLGLAGGPWWCALAYAAWRRPDWVRDGYRPFLAGFRRRPLLLVLAAGGLVASFWALSAGLGLVLPRTGPDPGGRPGDSRAPLPPAAAVSAGRGNRAVP